MCGNLLCYYNNYNQCARWVEQLGRFVKADVTLKQYRYQHLCWERENGVLLLGGSKSPKTTELVVIGGSASATKFNLMWPIDQSCGVDLGDRYLVIGGLINNLGGTKVTQYKDGGFDRVFPDLIIGRYGHACAKFQNGNGDEAIMVIGGWIDSKRSAQTEMMTLSSNNWKII